MTDEFVKSYYILQDKVLELRAKLKKVENFLNDWDGHDGSCGRNREGFEGCDETMFNCDCGYQKAKRKILEIINE